MLSKCFRFLVSIVLILMISVTASGCGSSNTGSNVSTGEKQQESSVASPSGEKELKEVTLRFFFPGDKKADTDKVWNAISEKFKKELNAKFEINYIGWSDFNDKMTIMAAAGDKYDMNFDANWTGLYPKMINSNAYKPLNDLLPQYAPKLYEMVDSTGALKACTVDGKIMSIPWTMLQNQARKFVTWRKDIAEKYGLKYDKDSIKTVEDCNKFLYEAKKVLPKNIQIIEWTNNSTQEPFLAKYQLVQLDFHGFVFDLNDPTCKLVPVEQTQAYKECVTMVKKWADDGLISRNMIVYKGDMNADFRSGKLLMQFTTHEWANANWGFQDSAAMLETSELYSDLKSYNRSSLANVVAINNNAANPERTLQFLEMVQTNREMYDMVMYGIKGETYVLDGEKAAYPQGVTAQSSNYMDWHGQWAMWNPEFMRPTDTYPSGFWKGEAEFARNSLNVPNKIDGLFFNTESIKNEIAKRDQIEGELGKQLMYGTVKNVDEALAQYIEQQKAAGLDKMLAELQKQVDDYLATNK